MAIDWLCTCKAQVHYCYRHKCAPMKGGCRLEQLLLRLRATCPKCGREDTPLKKNGREFKGHFPRGGGEWCYGPREEDMGYSTYGEEDYDIRTRVSRREEVVSKTIDALIRRAEVIQRQLEEALEREAMFGSDAEYPIDAVLLFKRKFSGTSRMYTYSAVKVSHNKWYITGMNSHAYSWESLVDEHLSKAAEVWFCRQWERVV